MSNLIKHPKGSQPYLASLEEAALWQVFRSEEGEESAALLPGHVLVPFSWWTSHGVKEPYQSRALKGEIGVWFGPEDDVLAHREVILAGLKIWPLIAVDFPIFRDGRGYSTAALLRERFGWKGELRAIGDILIDQILPLSRIGFDAFALRRDQNVQVALRQFDSIKFQLQNDWRGERAQLSIANPDERNQFSGSQAVKLWQIPQVDIPAAQIEAKAKELQERIAEITRRFKDVRFATSLAAEDMVITDAISTVKAGVKLFTLETGRLHQETLGMIGTVESHYGITIERAKPEQFDVDVYLAQYGLNGFYDSEEAKKACCYARKVKPLNYVLAGAQAWISGQRRDQAVTRSALVLEEQDQERLMVKFNPLFDWTDADVWAYIQARRVPIHPLHLKGYPSIGCEPCTRAVREGEDIRSGRWWWLSQDSKECGLHVK